ncbi:MAG: hypothetical protein ABIO85_00095 [Sphingomicrobium sp.]
MRKFILFPLLAVTSPALSQGAPYPAPYPGPYTFPAPPTGMPAIPQELFDPAVPAQLGRMAGALTGAFMRLPVGELEAAIAGRPVTPADRRKTVGSEARRDNPNIERDLQRDVASSAGRVQSGARAMQRAMPVVAQAMGQAVEAIERATANMPDPTYPRR